MESSHLRPETHASFWDYLGALLGATRPHFFALPVGAAFAGVAATGIELSAGKLLTLGVIAGGGWASGQLLNDVLDRDADAVDAPHRPAVRGLLPPKPTIALALTVGVGLLLRLTTLTPVGWQLGLVSMALILTYNRCKGVPGLGNISHGALIACASVIGASVADPTLGISELVHSTGGTLALVGTWAALYLQGNYEKDARGDAIAGYRTLAHVLGPKHSPILRAVGACLLVVPGARVLVEPAYIGPALVAVAVVVSSAIWSALHRQRDRALSAYRGTVHGATVGMLALGGAALPLFTYFVLLVGAILLTEEAFRRSPNP